MLTFPVGHSSLGIAQYCQKWRCPIHGGTPKSSIFIGSFPHKPSSYWGIPHFFPFRREEFGEFKSAPGTDKAGLCFGANRWVSFSGRVGERRFLKTISDIEKGVRFREIDHVFQRDVLEISRFGVDEVDPEICSYSEIGCTRVNAVNML